MFGYYYLRTVVPVKQKFEHLFDMGREDALMARKITKRQQQIYDFIKEYQQEKGLSAQCARDGICRGPFLPPAPCTPTYLPWRRAGCSSAMPPNRAPRTL